MNISHYLGWLHWNPERVVFTIPIIDRPVVWYGVFFVIGFVVGYFFMLSMFKRFILSTRPGTSLQSASDLAMLLCDRLSWFVVAGTIIGARLGEVFFYNWDYYSQYPGEIIKVWNGGLSSHGGTIGILIALAIYFRYAKKLVPSLTFIRLLDMICVPAAFVGCCIRIGNFFNQEILGNETTLPWGVIFEQPADYSAIVPRHPVQLYEAGFYLLLFAFLTFLWIKRGLTLRPGTLIGLFFILLFGARFLLEFFKLPYEAVLDQSLFNMGQYLSLPFILVGCWLLFRPAPPIREKT